MKLRFAVFAIASMALVAAPAVADILYDNGPVLNTQSAWTINFGFRVTDSLVANGTVQGLQFWALLLPGDIVQSVEVLIGSSPFGNDLFDSVVSITQSNCFTNLYGYNLCEESGSFSGPALNGSYWLTLQNGVVNDGDPVYWNENSGAGCQSPGCPSQAQENQLGTIPSEAFSIIGSPGTNTTPEPASFVLFASGALAIVGLLRRKGGNGLQ